MPTDVQTVYENAGSGQSTLTVPSFNVGSGSDRTLTLLLGHYDTDSATNEATDVVFEASGGDEPFTRKALARIAWGGRSICTELWVLDNPTDDTANIVVTMTEAVGNYLKAIVTEWTGANNGVGTTVGEDNGNSDTPATTFTTDESDSTIVGGYAHLFGIYGGSPGTGVTELDDSNDYDDDNPATVKGWMDSTGGSDTFSYTHGAGQRWSCAAIELLASAAEAARRIFITHV